MHAAAVKVELLIPGSQSLKAKRKVLISTIRKMRDAYPVAVAEVDHQDTWQRATLAIGVVAGERFMLDESIQAVLRMLDRRTDLEVVSSETSYLEVA